MKPNKNWVYGELKKTGVPVKDVCKEMGICTKTFYNKMDNLDALTAREIRILRRHTSDELCDALTR